MLSAPPLHKAVTDGDTLRVLKLLVEGVNPNAEDSVFGEPPLFEAAATDAPSIVVLLLLFSADANRHSRNTSATAVEFAPAGGPVQELLGAVVRGDSKKSMTLEMAAVAPVVDAVSLDSPEALILDWHLRAIGHPGILHLRALSTTRSPPPPPEKIELPVMPPMDTSEAEQHSVRRESSREFLSGLNSRLAGGRPVPSLHGSTMLLSPGSATARVAWATVAACSPREALTVLPAVSGAFAELLLDATDDTAWRHAIAQVACDVIDCDGRRTCPSGNVVSWRETFQEITTQQLYSWGVDGTVTGFGARAPQKAYSRPHALRFEVVKGRSQPLLHPPVRTIACGRRHNAIETMGQKVYVWGRDVIPPTTPPDGGGGAGRGLVRHVGSRAAAFDRPQRLTMQHNTETPSVRAPEPTINATSVTTSLSTTLLRLAGGWTNPEEMQESGGEQPEDQFRNPRHTWQLPANLPPLRKVVRGSSFNVALTCSGQVLAWRRPGMFGARLDGVPEEPKPMLPPDGEAAVDIAVGEDHVAILTECGRVWTFGWRQPSPLGRGPRPSADGTTLAAPITTLERIVQIDAGANFTLCVDATGVLWLFGEGPCIIGCFNDPHAVNEPKRVPQSAFGGRRVLAAACGEGHILVLTAWDPCCRLPQPGAWFLSSSSSLRERGNSTSDEAVVRR